MLTGCEEYKVVNEHLNLKHLLVLKQPNCPSS